MAAPAIPKLPTGLEIVAPFPESIEEVRHVRSTILLASVDNLRHLGHFDEYLLHLPKPHHPAVLDSVAAMWTPIDAASAHYAAIDALALPVSTQTKMARRAMERVGGTLLGTSISVAREAGATPWTVLPRMQQFWRRGYDGGGIAILKLGPKDARVEVAEFVLCKSPFYRCAFAGWLSGLVEMFCAKVYAKDRGAPHGPNSISVRLQWV
jgi:hypothetical protein